MRVRRALLTFVLGAIAVTAALGLYAVLVPDFGDLQAKVLATSASISGASILVLAVTPAWERRLVWPLPGAAAALIGTAFCLLVVGIWADVGHAGYWKTMGTAAFLSAWAVLVCLLALATLPRRYRWTFVVAATLTLALATVAIGSMWAEPDSNGIGRLAGALGVLSAAFVLTVPILHRASRAELQSSEHPVGGYCPRCGGPVREPAAVEPVTCARCGARFRVSFLAP